MGRMEKYINIQTKTINMATTMNYNFLFLNKVYKFELNKFLS